MINIKTIDYKKPLIMDENENGKIIIEKTFFKSIEADQYFIKMYKKNKNGDFVNVGYLYFGVDLDERISHFIGIYIKPEYRSNGYSSLLISTWIRFCFENNIYNLSTISRQRKPFIIYLLKLFSFELNNLNSYSLYGNNIYICSKAEVKDKKCIIFDNTEQEKHFINSPISTDDNYLILPYFDESTILLDTVLLNMKYHIQDESEAYSRSMKKYETFKNK